MPIDDKEEGRLLREAVRKRRGHGDFFSWRTRSTFLVPQRYSSRGGKATWLSTLNW